MAGKQSEKFDFDVSKVLNEFKVPGVDMDAITASQQKNIEALTQANKLAFEGVQAVMKRQMEIVRQAVEESAKASKDIAGAGSPQDQMVKQTEMTKEAFETVLSNMRELAEMMAKSNADAFDMLNKRYVDMLDEIREQIVKANKK